MNALDTNEIAETNEIKKLIYIIHILINSNKKSSETLKNIEHRVIKIETKIDYLPKIIAFGLTIVSVIISCAMWFITHYGK